MLTEDQRKGLYEFVAAVDTMLATEKKVISLKNEVSGETSRFDILRELSDTMGPVISIEPGCIKTASGSVCLCDTLKGPCMSISIFPTYKGVIPLTRSQHSDFAKFLTDLHASRH